MKKMTALGQILAKQSAVTKETPETEAVTEKSISQLLITLKVRIKIFSRIKFYSVSSRIKTQSCPVDSKKECLKQRKLWNF